MIEPTSWPVEHRAAAHVLLLAGLWSCVATSEVAAPEGTWGQRSTGTAHPRVAPSKADLGGSWGLERCRVRLLEVSPAMSQASAAVDEARAGLGAIQGLSAAQLGFELVGSNSDNPAQAFMGELNAHELSLAGGLGDTDPTTHVSAGLHGSLLLWDGGRLEALELAAEAGIAAAGSATEARAQLLTGQLNELWWGLAEARALAQGFEAREPALTAALAAARARFAGGSGLRSEVLSLEARELGRQQALAQARTTEARITRSLDSLLAIPAGTVHVYPDGTTDGPVAAPGTGQGLAELLAEARTGRADLRALEQGLVAQEAELEAAERSGGPTLAAFADTWLDGGTPAYELDRGSYRVGAALSWDLIDGGRRAAAAEGARARLRAARAALAAGVEAVELELIGSLADRDLAEARTTTAARRVEASGAALQELAAGYERGSVALERWLGAEAELHTSRMELALARIAVRRSDARLRLAVGQPLAGPAPSAGAPSNPRNISPESIP